MHLLTSLAVVVLWTLYTVNGLLTDIVQTVVGQDVRLPCNRTKVVDKPVDWTHKHTPHTAESPISSTGGVSLDFRHRFKLDATDYTLTILNVTTGDAGEYRCIEDRGYGDVHVVNLRVGQLSSTSITNTSVTVHFNYTGRATDYNVSAYNMTTHATYPVIGQNAFTATVHNLGPGCRYNVSVRSYSKGEYTETWTTANFSTVPWTPEQLQVVERGERCLTIRWFQHGRVTGYEAMIDETHLFYAEYKGVGTDSVTAKWCGLLLAKKYKVSITAVSDGVKSETISDYFKTRDWFVFGFAALMVVIIAISIVCGILPIFVRRDETSRPTDVVIYSVLLAALLFVIIVGIIVTYDFFGHDDLLAGNAILLIYGLLAVIICLSLLGRANYIYYRRRQTEDFLPLTPGQKSFIDGTNMSCLAEVIAVKLKELLEQLQRREWMTDAERQRIGSAGDPVAEVRELLNELKYSRRRMFNIFIKCLEEIGLKHLASIITVPKRELVPVDIIKNADNTTTGQDDPTCRLNDSDLTATVVKNFKDGEHGLFENGISIVGFSNWTCFRAHFHYETDDGSARLDELCNNGERLKKLISELAPGYDIHDIVFVPHRVTEANKAHLKSLSKI